jgi:hypothetical protein
MITTESRVGAAIATPARDRGRPGDSGARRAGLGIRRRPRSGHGVSCRNRLFLGRAGRPPGQRVTPSLGPSQALRT